MAASGDAIQSYLPYLYLMNGLYYSNCLRNEPSGYSACPSLGWMAFSPSDVQGAWYNPGSYNVTLTVQYPNKPANSYGGTVNVQMPENVGTNIIVDNPQGWPVTPSNATSVTQYLTLGSYIPKVNPGGVPGISIDVNQIKAPFGYTGASMFNQFIKSLIINYYLSGNLMKSCVQPLPTDGASLYDGTPENVWNDPGTFKPSNVFIDAPSISLPENTSEITYDRIGISNVFVNYVYWLAYKYSTDYIPGTAPVPMGKVDWNWHAEADWSAAQNAWVINRAASSVQQPVFTSVPNSTYPQWSEARPTAAGSTVVCAKP